MAAKLVWRRIDLKISRTAQRREKQGEGKINNCSTQRGKLDKK